MYLPILFIICLVPLFPDKIPLPLGRCYHSGGKSGKFVGVSNRRQVPYLGRSNSWTATCFRSTSRSKPYCGI